MSRYTNNPSLVIFNPPDDGEEFFVRTIDIMSDRVHELRYEHTEDGNGYKHPFSKGVEMIAVESEDGERQILLRHTQGKPLWEDFD